MAAKKVKKRDSKSGKNNRPKRTQNVRPGESISSEWSLRNCHRPIATYVTISFYVCIVAFLISIARDKMITWKNGGEDIIIDIDLAFDHLVQMACQHASCEKGALQAVGRTLVAGKNLKKKQKIIEMPREMQIWTLDAFRDEFISSKLAGARHLKTNKNLDHRAFHAAYIALLMHRDSGKMQGSPLSLWLKYLPTYKDWKEKYEHPVTFDAKEQNSLLGSHTLMYLLVSKKKEEIEAEYKALVHTSAEFGKAISYEDFIAARLNVQTRAFDFNLDDKDASQSELAGYKEKFGVDIREKMSTMVSGVLDSLNSHHKELNVGYEYFPESKKLCAYAGKDIAEGAELFLTYGDRSDLYPHYGFVNGDFSERISALLARHPMFDLRVDSESMHMEEQRAHILSYLQMDDGYKECVTNDDIVAMRFKRLKRKVLLAIVNRYGNWVVSFPARDGGTISVDHGVRSILSTGRLLALSHHDYDGKAFNILIDALDHLEKQDEQASLSLKHGSDGLEFRAFMWIWRLTNEALNQYCGSFDSLSRCLQTERSEMDYNDKFSKEWLAAYVRHQEIVALESLKLYTEETYPSYTKNNDLESPDFAVRNKMCPVGALNLF